MAARSIWNPTAHGMVVLVPVAVLVGLGVVSIYATETHAQPGLPHSAIRQLVFAAAGLAAMIMTLTVSYQRIGRWAYGLFALMLVVLMLLLLDKVIDLPLINEHKGARRWIDLPWFQIQPSELMKLAFIMSMAKYLQFRKNYRRLGGLLGPFVLTLVPMFLILPEPDLGTVILLLPVLFVMLFAAGARIRHFLLVLVLGLCAVPLIWAGMQPYQRGRISALLLQSEWFREQAAQGRFEFERIDLVTAEQALMWEYAEGFQLLRSKAALGSGGLTGQGFDKESVVLRYPFLPDKRNDFIFAVIGHQWGFVGSLVVILCYVVIAVGGVEIASLTYDPFGRLLAVGVVTIISAQALINIGMTVGLMPITGMTLPFVSYGGSSLVVNFIGVGLLVNIAQRRPVVIGPKPFEFVDDE